MTAENVFEETYWLLNKIGVVDTKKEFCRDWLNIGDSYFRGLRQNQKPPSFNVIAVCRSKLKYYSEALKRKADNDSRKLASDFDVLSARLDSAIYQQSKRVWMTQMADKQRNGLC